MILNFEFCTYYLLLHFAVNRLPVDRYLVCNIHCFCARYPILRQYRPRNPKRDAHFSFIHEIILINCAWYSLLLPEKIPPFDSVQRTERKNEAKSGEDENPKCHLRRTLIAVDHSFKTLSYNHQLG